MLQLGDASPVRMSLRGKASRLLEDGLLSHSESIGQRRQRARRTGLVFVRTVKKKVSGFSLANVINLIMS